METLAARCLRGVRAVLRAARERPHDGAVQALAARVYARLHAVPCALVAVLLRDADAAQLLRVERATHAQGARIATEAHWRALCLRDHGAAHKTAPDATWRMTYEACRRAAAQLLEQGVTAIFAANDQMALGAYQRAYALGLRIPEQLSVIGYDDTPQAISVYPLLTSVQIPFGEIARYTVEGLLRKLDGEAQPLQPRVIHPQLIVRNSTGIPA